MPVVDRLNDLSLDPPTTLHAPTQFHLFLALPPELRLHIYEAYFALSDPSHSDATVIAPKPHARTPHSTALLLASRQTHEEGMRVFHRCATLTLSLHPAFHRDVQGMAYFLDHIIKPGEYFAGETAQLAKFRNVHLTLSRPSKDTALEVQENWWQLIAPVSWSTVQLLGDLRIPHLSIAVNMGDLTALTPPGPADRAKVTFASFVAQPFFAAFGWRGVLQRARESRPRNELSAEDVLTAGAGRRFARATRERREARCMVHVTLWMGMLAERKGRELWLRRGGKRGSEGKGTKIVSDLLGDLVVEARKLVEGHEDGEGRDVWLVLETTKGK